MQGMIFIVQSDKPAEYVEKRTERFLHNAGVCLLLEAMKLAC